MFTWKELYAECNNCSRCELSKTRKNMVFGDGNPLAPLMFIGEEPGADEDEQGKPFVGRAGQLLTKGLEALNLKRQRDYYICNICKCRPENNRTPKEEEANSCIPFLRNQVALVKPKIIVCLGATSMNYVISSQWRITKDRGIWIEKKGFHMMATFHPAALFRDESKKQVFWQDLKSVRRKFDEIVTI